MTTKDSLKFHVVRSTFPTLVPRLSYALKPDTHRLRLAVSWPPFYFQLRPAKKQLFSPASKLWVHPLLSERADHRRYFVFQIINKPVAIGNSPWWYCPVVLCRREARMYPQTSSSWSALTLPQRQLCWNVVSSYLSIRHRCFVLS